MHLLGLTWDNRDRRTLFMTSVDLSLPYTDPVVTKSKNPEKTENFENVDIFPLFNVFCNISVTFYDLDLVDPS